VANPTRISIVVPAAFVSRASLRSTRHGGDAEPFEKEVVMIIQRSHTLASLLVLALVMPAWLSASAARGERTPLVRAVPARVIGATLRVVNNNPEAVSVVMLHERDAYPRSTAARKGTEVPQTWQESDEYPLGTVDGKASKVFQVPSELVGAADVRVVVTPIVDTPIDMSEDFEATPMTIAAGQQAFLYVASHALYSTFDGAADWDALPNRGMTLRVTNHSRGAVSIVIIGANREYLLGEVGHTQKTRVFEFPSALVGVPGVIITATRVTDRPIDGSDDFRSSPITIGLGHGVSLVVAHPGKNSKLTIN
jgi:hypothetical protein